MARPMGGPGADHIGMDDSGNANVTADTLGADPGMFPSAPDPMDGPGGDDIGMDGPDEPVVVSTWLAP